MKMITLGGLVIATWLLLGSRACAAPPASQPDFSDEQLRLLVGQLSDASYHVRQSAGEKLAQLDFRRIDRLIPLYKSTSQPEGRLRLRDLARAMFLAGRQAAFLPEGFLGLDYKQSAKTESNGTKTVTVEVNGVLPDSPAAKAGLRVGDVIVTLFGQAISREAGETFADKIRWIAPGDPVKVRVRRGPEGLDFVMTMGEPIKAEAAQAPPAEWLNQFKQFWRDKFDPDDPMDGL